jgi:hypothetical protein
MKHLTKVIAFVLLLGLASGVAQEEGTKQDASIPQIENYLAQCTPGRSNTNEAYYQMIEWVWTLSLHLTDNEFERVMSKENQISTTLVLHAPWIIEERMPVDSPLFTCWMIYREAWEVGDELPTLKNEWQDCVQSAIGEKIEDVEGEMGRHLRCMSASLKETS